jgi:hypothetical protein
MDDFFIVFPLWHDLGGQKEESSNKNGPDSDQEPEPPEN